MVSKIHGAQCQPDSVKNAKTAGGGLYCCLKGDICPLMVELDGMLTCLNGDCEEYNR